ncbi:DUF1461 domain-containing protein [Candidatus Woesearchaeota archaeon]|nr:DUF1461 domain-containing protein [Candidatus Woesearchaeota archaeon]
MRLLVWSTATTLSLLIILLAVLGTFHDDNFYDYAYQRNGAYEQLGREGAWQLTENYQAYLEGEEELKVFHNDQARHLADVKGLYALGKTLVRILTGLAAILLFSIGVSRKRTPLFKEAMRKTGIITLTTILVLGVLAVNWSWFFTGFHELLFQGNWTFHPATLTMRLWGGSFFIQAAIYIALKITITATVILCLRRALKSLTSPR